MERVRGPRNARRALGRLLEAVLANRAEANAVFDILAVLQSEDPEEIQDAVRACSRLFGALLERGELFVGQLPPEETVMAGSQGATRKYKVWMRHRYQSCCNRLAELLAHPSFQVKELALGTLMKFVQLEGAHPLEKPKWEGSYLFPRQLFKAVVDGLLSLEEDCSLLLSQFCEYLEHDDVRYHAMQAAADTTARVANAHPEVPLAFWNNVFTLLSAVSLPRQESDVANFYVKHAELSDKWKVTHLKEHRKAFQLMWLGFLKHKLPLSLYKKVLVIMHESILPHLAQPSLMIDFLTRAYDVGGAISLLALNGLFILIHEHNLEYPDFYRKLYGLLDPSVFHVKYRARFFHLADLFLSSSHLPAYLVAAFAKRLARLALTAPPEALLMVLPFICNLLRRHPACRVLVHRPRGPAGRRPLRPRRGGPSPEPSPGELPVGAAGAPAALPPRGVQGRQRHQPGAVRARGQHRAPPGAHRLRDLRAGPEEEVARGGAAGVRPRAGPAGPAWRPLRPALHTQLTRTLPPTSGFIGATQVAVGSRQGPGSPGAVPTGGSQQGAARGPSSPRARAASPELTVGP